MIELVNHSVIAGVHIALKSLNKNSCSPDLNCTKVYRIRVRSLNSVRTDETSFIWKKKNLGG